MKVLVVDDETDVMDLFLQRFRKEIKAGEISLHFAHSGEEAVEVLNTLNPMDIVLVLSDINMPGMSGFDLLKIIKEKFVHLKVYMISAYGDTENMNRASNLGVDDFITKPVDFEKLKSKLITNQ
jgi:YesN/AraC family two-component response regulator